MIDTIYGRMDKNELVKSTGTQEDENQVLNWVEYRLNDEIVHRSVHLHLKRGIVVDDTQPGTIG